MGRSSRLDFAGSDVHYEDGSHACPGRLQHVIASRFCTGQGCTWPDEALHQILGLHLLGRLDGQGHATALSNGRRYGWAQTNNPFHESVCTQHDGPIGCAKILDGSVVESMLMNNTRCADVAPNRGRHDAQGLFQLGR